MNGGAQWQPTAVHRKRCSDNSPARPSDREYVSASETGCGAAARLLFRIVFLPFAVRQLREVVAVRGNVFQVFLQLEQFGVFLPVEVCLAEWSDFQSTLWVHKEIASYVVEHDGVLGRVLLVFAPYNAERLHVQRAQFAVIDADHGRTAQIEEDFVVGIRGDAQHLHFLDDPAHAGGRPNDNVIVLVGGCEEFVQIGAHQFGGWVHETKNDNKA